MQRIIYIKNHKGHKIGDVEIVSNNIAHGLIDSNIAQIYHSRIVDIMKKVLMRPPADKMMRPETRLERKTRQREERIAKGKYKVSKGTYQIK